jgi:HPt (histidine-containing phosphotransfer) domain-containing protein
MNNRLIELGLNADEAVRRFMGKQELFVKSLKKFVVDITENGVVSTQDAMGMEPEDFRKYVHGLKGVTANLSMLEMNALLIEIEQTIKAGNPDFEKYEHFSEVFPKLAREILDLIIAEEGPAETKASSAGETPGSAEECREHLMKLNKYLMLGMAKECEGVMALLREKAWEGFDENLIKGICDAVDGYDYAKAMEMIDEAR